MKCAMCSVQCEVAGVQCEVCIEQCKMCSFSYVHSGVNIVDHSVESEVCILQYD